MCGRYSFKQANALRDLIASLTEEQYEELMTRYNVAPTQINPVIVSGPKKPKAAKMKWGTFVSFAPDSAPTFLINARSETALQKRTFSKAMKEQRCLIPADGFYEWKRDAKGRSKQAYYFQRREGAPYMMAGLRWTADVEQPERYIVLTTAPNALLEPIHDRMPVILSVEAAKRWIDPMMSGEEARELCQSYPASDMTCYPVSAIVNSAKNEVPECVAPVSESPEIEKPSDQGELF